MASIHSQKEHDRIEKLLDDSFSAYWIGFHDQNKEGNWEFKDKTCGSYTNWMEGEPNSHSVDEDCACIYFRK